MGEATERDEEVVKPDLLGKVDDPKDRAELVHFKPPSFKTMRTKRRIFDIEMWIVRQGRVVGDGELVQFIETRYDLPREQARRLFREVVKDFGRKGLVYAK